MGLIENLYERIDHLRRHNSVW